MQKINLHTHTIHCDGKNTPEEMILSAMEKGFSVLGFSSHCCFPLSTDFYSDFDSIWHIPDNKTGDYVNTIRELKQKYAGKIEVLLGFEADFLSSKKFGTTRPDFSAYSPLNPDYLIGSVHFIANDKGLYSVDNTTDEVLKALKEMYSTGNDTFNGKAVVHDYFEAERQMLETCNFNILGHPDLIRLRNKDLHYFDENESWYKEELKLTAKCAAKAGVIVEINTGALARGIMDDVYPSHQFLEYLKAANVPVCINSDAHKTESLDFAFEKAMSIAKKIGYKELTYPIADKITHISL